MVDELYGTIAGKMYPLGGDIPMWGETGAIAISPDNRNNQSVDLTRAIARIDVGVGTLDNTGVTNGGEWEWDGKVGGQNVPFRLASVHVFRANDRYSIIPDATTLEAKKATVPGGTTAFEYTPSPAEDMFKYTDVDADNLYITQQMYVPEANTKIDDAATPGDANHTKRMAIVVGGVYLGNDPTNTKVTYYRLDFAEDGALMNVLRNHLYQFNIDAVAGDGYDDPVETYESRTINMSCTVLAWNEGGTGNVGFDGPYHFYLSPGEFAFDGEGGTQTLTLDTDYKTWTATLSYNKDGTGGVPAWLTLDNYSGVDSATEQTITITATANTDHLTSPTARRGSPLPQDECRSK